MNPLTKKLQNEADSIINRSMFWTGSIRMNCFVDNIPTRNYNLLETVLSFHKKTAPLVRFCPIYYPITGGFEGEGWKKLSRDIGLAGQIGECNLILNRSEGAREKNKPFRDICCWKCRKHKEINNSNVRKEEDKKRNRSWRNDAKNSRGEFGQTFVRETNTQRPTENYNCCKFSFRVGIFQ